MGHISTSSGFHQGEQHEHFVGQYEESRGQYEEMIYDVARAATVTDTSEQPNEAAQKFYDRSRHKQYKQRNLRKACRSSTQTMQVK